LTLTLTLTLFPSSRDLRPPRRGDFHAERGFSPDKGRKQEGLQGGVPPPDHVGIFDFFGGGKTKEGTFLGAS